MDEETSVQLQYLVAIAVTAVCAIVTSLFYIIKTENKKLRREQDKRFDAGEEKLQHLRGQITEIVAQGKVQEERYGIIEGKLQELDKNLQRPITPIGPMTGRVENPWAQLDTRKKADLLECMRDANPLFLRHDDILEKIYNSYTKDCRDRQAATHPTKRKTVVHIVNGLAGCGKSEIAIQYVNKYSHEYRGGVLWIPAGSLSALDYVLKQTAEKLHLPTTDYRANHTQKAITDWLQEQADWLLIFDNADDAGCIYDYFPRFPDGGHIIITSRDRGFKSTLYPAIKAPFEVKPLTQEDAEMVLAKSYFIEAGDDHVENDVARKKLQIMKEEEPEEYAALQWLAGPDGLDGLPLALNTATRYIKENERSFKEYKIYSQSFLMRELFPDFDDDPLKAWLRRLGLNKYYDKFNDKTQKSLSAFLELTKENLLNEIKMTQPEVNTFIEERKHDVIINKWMYRRKEVLATWGLTFRRIVEMTNGPAAMELLQLCAYLTPTLSEHVIVKGAKFITLEKLRDGLLVDDRSHPEWSHKDVLIQRNLDEILQCLRRYSLIESLPSPGGKPRTRRSFTFHRVVTEAVKAELKREDIIKVISCAIKVLTNLMPSFEDIQRNFTRHYRPLPELQEEVAMHVKFLSRNLKQEWLKPTERSVTEIEDPVPLLNAAALYFERFKWRHEEAQRLYAKAFECTTILTTADSAETRARKLGNAECQLGLVLLKLGERKVATSHLQAAEEHFSKCCKDTDSDLDVAKYNYLMAQALGDEYWKLGKPPPDRIKDEIVERIEKSISISKKYHENLKEEYGEWTALSMHDLASFYLQMGPRDMPKIARLLEESLQIKERVFGSEDNGDHISTAIGMGDLARFFILNQDQDKFKEGEELLLKALAMKERVIRHYQQSDTWQLGVYYLVRMYMLLEKKDDEKKYRDMLDKADTKMSFDELFEASDPYKAYPPEPFYGHETYCR